MNRVLHQRRATADLLLDLERSKISLRAIVGERFIRIVSNPDYVGLLLDEGAVNPSLT